MDAPEYVLNWAWATGKKFEGQVVTGHGKARRYYYSLDDKGQVEGDVSQLDAPRWLADVTRGLHDKGFNVETGIFLGTPSDPAVIYRATGDDYIEALNAAITKAREAK